MTRYSFDEFKKNILKLKDDITDSYFFEVMLTDFYCFENNISPEKIYISQPINDGKIDAIVLPKPSKDTLVKTIFFIQVSTSSKTSAYIKEFININPFKIKKYNEILKQYINYNQHKVLITFEPSNKRVKSEDLEILSGDELFECMFENSIRYKLISNKNSFYDNYINNIKTRTFLWKDLHRLEMYDNSTIDSYIYFLTLNNNSIKNNEFDLINNLKLIWMSYYKDLLTTFKKLDSDSRDQILSGDEDNILILMNILKYNNPKKLEPSLVHLIITLNYLKNNTKKLKNIILKPTKQYLSLYYNDKCIAYFQYQYNKKDVKKSRFSFKCNLDKLNKSSYDKKTLIKEYIQHNRLVPTKLENGINKGLKHTGMYTTLIEPSKSDDDWDIIKILLCESIDTLNN